MTLESALRAAAAAGCDGFTIWPAGGSWQAGVRSEGGWRIGIDADPAVALAKALRMPPAPDPDEEGAFA